MSERGEIAAGPGAQALAAGFRAALAGLSVPPEVPGAQTGAQTEAAQAEDDAPRVLRDGGYDVERLNREWALVLMGGKAVVMREQGGGAPVEDRQRFLTVDSFRLWLGNTCTEVPAADGKIRALSHAERWLKDRHRRQYSGIQFFPNPDGVECFRDYLNLWRGFAVVPKARENGYAIFHDHILNNVCHGDEGLFRWVFGWFAHMVQRPRERVGTALVMRGRMGTGKTKVGEVMGSLFPAHYFAVDDPRYVTGQFNAHMASCLLLQAEEAVWAGDKAAEGRLKGLVTSKFQMIESKGVDPIRLDNYVRLMMTSNEDWVVPAGKDERRFCVLDIHPRCAQNSDYFREMEEQLADGGREALLHDLLSFDLSQVDLRRIPRTKALLEQKLSSLHSVEEWWYGRLFAGALTRSGRAWGQAVPSRVLYDDYLHEAERVGWRRRDSPTAFGKRLRKVVPGLHRDKDYDAEGGSSTPREWCLTFPALGACREAWDSAMGQTDEWPDAET
ncbi:primase-helicase family protein [Xanthobacter sp. TB0139]|uniref:primase-helicase family protein n=1 Tax=Xanthobacter sp. TB0139 TaxID=3459178 RepID=UPI0040391576